jgi:hypothetical protein
LKTEILFFLESQCLAEMQEERATQRGNGQEARRMQNARGSFNLRGSTAYVELQSRYENPCRIELMAIATLAKWFDPDLPRLDRDVKRDLTCLYKWFDVNWEQISPLLPSIHLEDYGYRVIGDTSGD